MPTNVLALDATGRKTEVSVLVPADVTGGDGSVPYELATGETFTVPVRRQALFNMPIDVNGGTVVIDGYLVEVT